MQSTDEDFLKVLLPNVNIPSKTSPPPPIPKLTFTTNSPKDRLKPIPQPPSNHFFFQITPESKAKPPIPKTKDKRMIYPSILNTQSSVSRLAEPPTTDVAVDAGIRGRLPLAGQSALIRAAEASFGNFLRGEGLCFVKRGV